MNSKKYSVVTEVTLDTQQIKFLIDLMWAYPFGIVKDASDRHGVDDVELEHHLQVCLGSALSE